MKPLYIAFGVLLLVIVIMYALPKPSLEKADNTTPTSGAPATFEPVEGVAVTPINHASLILRSGTSVIYVDPVGGAAPYAKQPAPTHILVTDIHGDHMSTATIAAIMTPTTAIIAPRAVLDKFDDALRSRTTEMANGQQTSTNGMLITAIPMYNIPETEKAFHTKGRGNGYLLTLDGKRVYVAGDTSGTPEMRSLANIDIAFIPMNLPYTMTVEEAADAVLAFRPKQVYPYHYREPDGFADVEKFKSLVNAGNPSIDVVMAKWY